MFDPYHKWLGIPPAEQPANYYRLLGIALLENDPSVIETAADQRLLHLRTFQSSQENAIAERLLNEVTSAKLCLLRPDRKAQYDARFGPIDRAHAPPVAAVHYASPRQAAPPTAAPPIHAIPTAVPIFTPVDDCISPLTYEIPAGKKAFAPLRQTRKSISPFVIVGPLIGVAAVAAAIVAMNYTDDPPAPSPQPAKRTVASLHPVVISPKNQLQAWPARPLPQPSFPQGRHAPAQPARDSPILVSEFFSDLAGPVAQDAVDIFMAIASIPDMIREPNKSELLGLLVVFKDMGARPKRVVPNLGVFVDPAPGATQASVTGFITRINTEVYRISGLDTQVRKDLAHGTLLLGMADYLKNRSLTFRFRIDDVTEDPAGSSGTLMKVAVSAPQSTNGLDSTADWFSLPINSTTATKINVGDTLSLTGRGCLVAALSRNEFRLPTGATLIGSFESKTSSYRYGIALQSLKWTIQPK